MWQVVLPIRVKQSKKKMFSLNLNIYRNAHFMVLNNAKIEFAETIAPQLKTLPVFNKCVFRYYLYPKSKRLCDVANVCTVVDKFFSDALVSAGKIPDDNYEHLLGVSYEFAEIDKHNPRVVVEIHEIG